MPKAQEGTVLVTGSKFKTYTGYYYVVVDGKRRQKSKVLGRKADMTLTDARAALVEIIKAPPVPVPAPPPIPEPEPEAEAVPDPPVPKTFQDAAVNYLSLKSGDWAQKTQETMASLFKTLINPRIGHRLVNSILSEDCKALFNALASRGLSKSTLDKCVTHVRAVFDYEIEARRLLQNPAKSKSIRVPKSKRKVDGRFLTLEQCHKLLAVAEGYDLMLLKIMLGTALRPSEAFALRVDDIEPGQLRIDEAAVCNQPLGATKTEGSDGHVPISAELEGDLREYIKDLDDPKAFLFPGETGQPMIHENYLERRLKPLGLKAGVGDINFQMFRRTVATNLQDHGPVTSAQGLLRHMNSSTTLKNYVKQIPDGVRRTADSWDAALRQKPKARSSSKKPKTAGG